MIGSLIDSKYEIVRQLGQGGMGAVYEARHRGTGRRVAVKVIVPEALKQGGEVLERFAREARASGSIESQHVAQVLDSGVDPATSSPFLVLEYLSGEDVFDAVARLGPLPPNVAVRILAQACAGLERAHEQGIVHRDIKSANLFLARREGAEICVKILDFGIAKLRADELGTQNNSLTRTGSMLGSPLYMSPEQIEGSRPIDVRSDLWSLGVTLYETLTGATPHAGCDTLGSLILAICSRPTPPVQERAPWVPHDVAALVHKALALRVEDRYQTAAEFGHALNALLPQGHGLQERDFVGLTATEQSDVRPRCEGEPGLPRSAVPASVAAGAAHAGFTARTQLLDSSSHSLATSNDRVSTSSTMAGVGLGRTTGSRGQSGKYYLALAAAVVTVIVAGLLLLRLQGDTPAPAPAFVVAAPPVQPTIAPPIELPAAAPPAPSTNAAVVTSSPAAHRPKAGGKQTGAANPGPAHPAAHAPAKPSDEPDRDFEGK